MRLLEKLYRSPLGRIMSLVASGYARLQKPFMLYGFIDPTSKSFRKYTRLSSSVVIINKQRLSIGDYVWIGHYSVLDASIGLTIEEGCQTGPSITILTHGSQDSIRLLGRQFVNIHNTQRLGYTRGAVRIGAYTFLGAGSVVLPGVTIGKGSIIGAGAVVTKSVPDFSIVVGIPGQVIGSTIDIDAEFFKSHDVSETYFDKSALALVKQKLGEHEDKDATPDE
jgi:acetyltransferase-like isoleucine patch superfamily enzyme